jgi:hypothetical protein
MRGRNGLLSPLTTRHKGQHAVRSPFQSMDRTEEERNQRISNFDPVQEMTHHVRCITALRMSSDSASPFIGESVIQWC